LKPPDSGSLRATRGAEWTLISATVAEIIFAFDFTFRLGRALAGRFSPVLVFAFDCFFDLGFTRSGSLPIRLAIPLFEGFIRDLALSRSSANFLRCACF
jgi:hypothetical protein